MNIGGRQEGMTFIGWMIVLGLIAFFALLVLRLVPAYLENMEVVGSLKSLRQEPFVTDHTPLEIRRLMEKRFDMNAVTNAKLSDIHVEKKKGWMKVRVTYEVRIPILGNVDAVTRFDDAVELVAQ